MEPELLETDLTSDTLSSSLKTENMEPVLSSDLNMVTTQFTLLMNLLGWSMLDQTFSVLLVFTKVLLVMFIQQALNLNSVDTTLPLVLEIRSTLETSFDGLRLDV
jgi:hypothetical protein